MKFNVKCVRDCLLNNKVVFTVRSYLYDNKESEFDGGKIKRFLIREVDCKEDLSDFVKLSGFDSVDEWWDKIVMFCRDKKKYLYLVLIQ